jgi:hypothetical protein
MITPQDARGCFTRCSIRSYRPPATCRRPTASRQPDPAPTNYTRLPHRVRSPRPQQMWGRGHRWVSGDELRRAERAWNAGSCRASQTGARAKENPCLRKQFRRSSAPENPKRTPSPEREPRWEMPLPPETVRYTPPLWLGIVATVGSIAAVLCPALAGAGGAVHPWHHSRRSSRLSMGAGTRLGQPQHQPAQPRSQGVGNHCADGRRQGQGGGVDPSRVSGSCE